MGRARPASDCGAFFSQVTAAPQRCDGAALVISADVHAAGGYVQASVRPAGAGGSAPQGAGVGLSLKVGRNVTDARVAWPAGTPSPLAALHGQRVVTPPRDSGAQKLLLGPKQYEEQQGKKDYGREWEQPPEK